MWNLTRILSSLAAMAWSSSLSAQQVIAASGAEYSNGSGSIAFTIGQPVNATVSGGANALTQGFHQPWGDISTLVDDTPAGLSINAYPNPAREELFVEVTGPHPDWSWQLTDAIGRVIGQGRLTEDRTTLDVASQASGNYLVRITDGNGIPAKTFQLIITK